MKNSFILFLSIYSCFLFSQSSYVWPIDSPIIITGNYGELRPNHFHAGIDFSTKGRVNLPVYCVENGYVSRIKISSGGYGKAIYITHPNGKVSVYGHLNSLNPLIAEVVKKEQFAKQNYEIDFYPKPKTILFKKGEQIAKSGNTGSSTGAHLHFELRDEKTEVPLNPMHEYDFEDTILPEIKHIAFYNLADTTSPKFLGSFPIKKFKDSSVVSNDSIILNNSILGFAFSAYDQFTLKGNLNNVYSASVFFDGRLIYSHNMKAISFDDARFVNEFSEEIEKSKTEKIKFQKCFLPALYPQGLFENCFNKGRIILFDTNYHAIKLIVFDEYGNERAVKFWVKTKKFNYYAPPTIKSDVFVNCAKDFMISKNKLQIFIPAKTLYYSTGLIFENTLETTGKLIILPTDANLKSTSIVGFEVPKKYLRNKSKLILKSGSSTFTPIVNKDSVFYSVRNFGWFQIEQDTLAPKIKTKLSASQLLKVKNFSEFSFDIRDDLSGIYNCNLFLNSKWVIGEYDAKSHSVTYYFDSDTPPGNLNFKLEVEDRVGNKASYVYSLKRK
ncbi:MAG: M23 family metallopeptidase [Bacteroidota bacterium]|nr:M23 family metallopeptidase [Bacteroidota bacterium]MDP3146598.1 M23 family metallopeptidase [Bacteroidota bacterium]